MRWPRKEPDMGDCSRSRPVRNLGTPVGVSLCVVRTVRDARPSLPTRLALRRAASERTPGQRRAGLGLLIPGSANDPKRARRF